MAGQLDRLTLENVQILFRNFAGETGQYNRNGDRTFSVLIEDAGFAADLADAGWNVRELKTRDEEGSVQYHLPVKVGYEGRYPPRVYAVKSAGKMFLTEDTIRMLDLLTVSHADVVLNAYHWSVQDESGVKAYLHTLYAVIDESELDLKYSEVEDIH